jgi:tetratricopeptide (TPR) repeat protein
MILQDRRFLLTLVLGGLIPAFAATHFVVSRFKAQRLQLADEWSERGTRNLSSTPAVAAIDFQTALSYDPGRALDRLHLSRALTADGRPAEARAELLTLWMDAPGDGEVNLDLARLSAANGNLAEAVRYYHAAIDGAWESGATSARRETRLELARLLLGSGQRLAAQAELIALIDDLPSDSSAMTEVGSLLARAGADERALALLSSAVSLDPANSRAAALAGRVAYRSADYRRARTFFAAAAKTAGSLDPETQGMLAVANRVLALDPSARGLGTRARVQRVLEGLKVAAARLQQCQTHGPSDDATAARLSDMQRRVEASGKLRRTALERDPDLTDQTISLVFEIEKLPESACGPSSPDDRALQLLAEQRPPASR